MTDHDERELASEAHALIRMNLCYFREYRKLGVEELNHALEAARMACRRFSEDAQECAEHYEQIGAEVAAEWPDEIFSVRDFQMLVCMIAAVSFLQAHAPDLLVDLPLAPAPPDRGSIH